MPLLMMMLRPGHAAYLALWLLCYDACRHIEHTLPFYALIIALRTLPRDADVYADAALRHAARSAY